MRHERHRFNSWVGKIPWRRAWQPNSSILARKIPWTEEPGGLHSWSHQESDTTEATWHTRMQWGWGVKERQFEPGVWCFSHLSPAQRVTEWNLPECSFADARTDGGWREPPILEQVCSIHSSCWCNKEFLFRSQWQEWTLCLLGPPLPPPPGALGFCETLRTPGAAGQGKKRLPVFGRCVQGGVEAFRFTLTSNSEFFGIWSLV